MFKRYWWMLLAMAPVGLLAGFLIASVVTYLIPTEYESFSTIEIRPRIKMDTDQRPSPGLPGFHKTEFEKIKSRNTLVKVVDTLDLANKWSLDREDVLLALRSIVKTGNIRGTDLVSITVRHTNREDARDIAAEVARAYREYREELESKSLDGILLEMKKVLREQEDTLEDSRGVLKRYANRGSIPLDAANLPEQGEGQNYEVARRIFETELGIYEQIKLKMLEAEIARANVPEAIVVHDDPVISDTPVSPNVALNLVLGAAGGLLVSPFLALPLMWWLHLRNPVKV